MKKIMTFVLCLFMIMSLTACGNSVDEPIIQENVADSTTNDTTLDQPEDTNNSEGKENQPEEPEPSDEVTPEDSGNTDDDLNPDSKENQPVEPEVPEEVIPEDSSKPADVDSSDTIENQPEEIETPE